MLRRISDSKSLSREIVIKALNDERLANTLTDESLNFTIELEEERGEYNMDCDLLDACVRILEGRNSTISKYHLAKSVRQVRRGLNKAIRKNAAQAQSRSFPVRVFAIASLIVLLFLSPVLIKKLPFLVNTTLDEEQYLIIGIGQADIGTARASRAMPIISPKAKLQSLNEIPRHLGYKVELPTWIPDDCALEAISIYRDEHFDELLVTYSANEKRITVVVTYFDSREGAGTSFEQVKNGKQHELANGETIYTSSNLNSAWGSFHSSSLSYFINAVGYGEEMLLKIFNSIGEDYEKK